MTTISIDDMQHDLAGYLDRVQAGKKLLITQAGRPVAEFNPISSADIALAETSRPSGLAEGEFQVPDDFDAPLPEDVLRDFEG